MIGYSLGEYITACCAGVIGLEDALRLVYKRSKFISEIPEGSMVSVPLSEEDIKPYLKKGLYIAIISSPHHTIVAGIEEEVLKFEQTMKSKEILTVRLPNTHAIHTPMLETIKEKILSLTSKIKFNKPQIKYISNVTGKWITEGDIFNPEYWANHSCKTVRFSDGITELLKESDRVFLEIGPGQSLGSFIIQHTDYNKTKNFIILSSLPNQNILQPAEAFWLNNLGKMWMLGANIKWS